MTMCGTPDRPAEAPTAAARSRVSAARLSGAQSERRRRTTLTPPWLPAIALPGSRSSWNTCAYGLSCGSSPRFSLSIHQPSTGSTGSAVKVATTCTVGAPGDCGPEGLPAPARSASSGARARPGKSSRTVIVPSPCPRAASHRTTAAATSPGGRGSPRRPDDVRVVRRRGGRTTSERVLGYRASTERARPSTAVFAVT